MRWTILLLVFAVLPAIVSASTYVIIDEFSNMAYSYNGYDYNLQSGQNLIDVYYSEAEDQFVGVGYSGTIKTSPDGRTWTSRTNPFDTDDIVDIHYSERDDLWVAISYYRLATSPDGINWTERTTPQSQVDNNFVLRVTYSESDDLWMAAGSFDNDAYTVMTSPDGITWTKRRIPSFDTNQDFAYDVDRSDDEDLWVVVGRENNLATSPDGITWTERSLGFTTLTPAYSVQRSENDDLWIVGGRYNDANYAYSSDGITWTTGIIGSLDHVYMISRSEYDDIWFAHTNTGIYTSSDGLNWSKDTSGLGSSYNAVDVDSPGFAVGNQDPSVSSVDITPDPAYTISNLTGTYTFTDNDDDDSSYYRWFKNDTVITAATGTTLLNGNFSKGDTIIFEVTPYDGHENGTADNSSALTISNSLPVASDVTVSADDETVLLNCSYTYNDADGDALDTTYYDWFVNGSSTGTTNDSLTNSSYSDGDSVICQVTPYDGTENGTAVNSSTYVLGDSTPPVISAISVPLTATTTASTAITLTCTDANLLADGFPRGQWTDPNGEVRGNFTFENTAGDNYSRSYTFSTVGNWTDFTFYCQDGTGNLATSTASNNLTASAPAAEGGGGGGTVITPTPGVCGVEVRRPTDPNRGLTSVFCPINGFKTESIVLYNPGSTDTTYSIAFDDMSCDAVQPVNVSGRTSKQVVLENCACPTTEQKAAGENVEGFIVVTDLDRSGADCSEKIRFTARGSAIAANPLLYGGLGFILLVFISVLLGVLR